MLIGASHFDRSLTDGTRRLAQDTPLQVVEEFGNAKAVRPMGFVVFIGGALSGDQRFQDASFTAVEAIFFAKLATGFVKTVV